MARAQEAHSPCHFPGTSTWQEVLPFPLHLHHLMVMLLFPTCHFPYLQEQLLPLYHKEWTWTDSSRCLEVSSRHHLYPTARTDKDSRHLLFQAFQALPLLYRECCHLGSFRRLAFLCHL